MEVFENTGEDDCVVGTLWQLDVLEPLASDIESVLVARFIGAFRRRFYPLDTPAVGPQRHQEVTAATTDIQHEAVRRATPSQPRHDLPLLTVAVQRLKALDKPAAPGAAVAWRIELVNRCDRRARAQIGQAAAEAAHHRVGLSAVRLQPVMRTRDGTRPLVPAQRTRSVLEPVRRPSSRRCHVGMLTQPAT